VIDNGRRMAYDEDLTERVREWLAVRSEGVAPMDTRGREMAGWLRVDSEALEATAQLETLARRGVAYARSFPPKG
jgi:hypothetical protein